MKRNWLDILPGGLLALSLLFSLVSISLEQVFFFLAVAAWVVRTVKAKERLAFPRFFVPLLVYAGLSLLASALSVNRGDSFRDSRELLLLVMVPLAYTAFRSVREIGRANAAILISAGLLAALAIFGGPLILMQKVTEWDAAQLERPAQTDPRRSHDVLAERDRGERHGPGGMEGQGHFRARRRRHGLRGQREPRRCPQRIRTQGVA